MADDFPFNLPSLVAFTAAGVAALVCVLTGLLPPGAINMAAALLLISAFAWVMVGVEAAWEHFRG